MDSLAAFQACGGRVVVVDTGSSDNSVEVFRARGAEVTEVDERFMRTIDADLADSINQRFVDGGEPPIVQDGSRLFDFAAARNFCASLATNDWVCWADADEAFTALDLDKIAEIIADPRLEHLEYDFVFAHNPDGVTPAVAFTQSKFYRRSRIEWRGAVHEVITPIPNIPPRQEDGPNHLFVQPNIFHLEHWQEPRAHRANYLPGLGWDAWIKLTEDPAGNRDRQLHYLGRELLWTGRPKSAIKVLKEHVDMNAWPAERAQSMIFLGDAYGLIGDDSAQLEWYSRAFFTDPTRREALLRHAEYYRKRSNHSASAAYAAASLEIPWHPFYANQVRDYRAGPHAYLYYAKGWMGDVAGARHHLMEALRYEPFNEEFLRDTQFYYEYGDKHIEGWMVFPELTWLFENAKNKKRILEVGSWKGRSTHALCTGAAKYGGGTVFAVDHFSGSVGEDIQHAEAKADPDSIFRQFSENTKDCTNLVVRRADSLEAAKEFPDGYFDMLFLDGSHDECSVIKDIAAWSNKVRPGGTLCGHDWGTWPGVVSAVRSTLGEPDGVETSIWHKRRQEQPGNPLLGYLTDCVRKGLPISFIKKGDGEEACMAGATGANCDGHLYSSELGQKLKTAFWQLEKMSEKRDNGRVVVNVVPFGDQRFYNSLLHRVDQDFHAVKEFWGAVREAEAPKTFVGPARLKPVATMLKADFVEIPLVNAFEQYDAIREQLMWHVKPGATFVFCGGMPAKVWIANLLAREQTISCIDAGSAWDNLIVDSGTRTMQIPQWLMELEYKEWMNG
jgi:glycosyltransferase involved in cell wall biosynthesis